MKNKRKINKEDFEKWANKQINDPEFIKQQEELEKEFHKNIELFGFTLANQMLSDKLQKQKDGEQ